MSHRWRIFELIIATIQICFGIVMLFVVYTTLTTYYHTLWINPLIEPKSIIEVALKKNTSLVIVALVAISSGILLIKNKSKGYFMSIITWIMFIVLLVINCFRMHQRDALELHLISKIILILTVLVFIAIAILLNHAVFRQKHKPTKKNWFVIAIIVIAITASKFI
jgi:hypothetical protein